MPVNDPLFADMPVDLREMIARPMEDFPAQPLLPTCHYFGQVVDVLTGLSKNVGTRYFAFICQPTEVCDLDPEGKAAQQTLNGVDLSDYEFPRRDRVGTGLPAGQIWISPKAMSMNREFLTGMGFPEAKPFDECIVEMRGRKVLMGIGREKSERNGREYNVMVTLAQDPR
jgi:hypothetical protein